MLHILRNVYIYGESSTMSAGILDELSQLETSPRTDPSMKHRVERVWYTKADICRHFGITYTTLYRWERYINFPPLEFSHYCTGRYNIRQVEAFLKKRI